MVRARSLSEFQKALTKRAALRSCSNGAGRTASSALTVRQAPRGDSEKPAGFIRMPRLRATLSCRGFIGLSSLMKRWSLGTYHGLRRKHVDSQDASPPTQGVSRDQPIKPA